MKQEDIDYLNNLCDILNNKATIPTSLTLEQKIAALSLKYYDGFMWFPKSGDYYTTSRNDLELYKIEKEDDEFFYTIYCNIEGCNPSQWKKTEFLKDFGVFRVFVPDIILSL
jgi:hypothetical protein